MAQNQFRLPSTAGHFQLDIDGHDNPAYLNAVEGGFVRHGNVNESVGADNLKIKHSSQVEIEPFTITFGFASAGSILKWIQSSWRKNVTRRNGQITHADFNLNPTYEHEFTGAILTETIFPELDGSSTKPAMLKIKFQPETVHSSRINSGAQVRPISNVQQKAWLCSGFRLTVDGVSGFEYTSQISSFSVKQSTRNFFVGQDRYAQVEPGRIEFPTITGSIAEGDYVRNIEEWYQQSVAQGMSDWRAQRTGALEFLAPDRTEVLFRLKFEGGLNGFSMAPSTANASEIKRRKFELYFEKFDLDGGVFNAIGGIAGKIGLPTEAPIKI
jgi:hypothetical protein